MIAILKNDFIRFAREKNRIIMNIAITAGMILIAIFFASRPASASPVAYVAQAGSVAQAPAALAPAGYSVAEMKVAPPLSSLVSGKYEAIVSGTKETGYVVKTLKNAEYERRLFSALAGSPEMSTASEKRGAGSTISGFLLMFMMMQGTMMLYLFADDKELKILPRIASTPLPITRYLAAHGLFAFLAILLPNLAILYAIKFITGSDIGFTLFEYVLLFAVASALSTGFSLFMNALASKGDTANMAGSAIVTLTSVLAGSFYSFERGNPVLETFVKLLPQKAWLESASLMEKGIPLSQSAHHLTYPLALSLFFFTVAFAKTGRDYIGRK